MADRVSEHTLSDLVAGKPAPRREPPNAIIKGLREDYPDLAEFDDDVLVQAVRETDFADMDDDVFHRALLDAYPEPGPLQIAGEFVKEVGRELKADFTGPATAVAKLPAAGLEQPLEELTSVTYQDLLNRGYSPEIAQHVMRGRTETAQSLAGELGTAGAEGQEAAARGAAAYASTAIGGMAERALGGKGAQQAIQGGAKQLASFIPGYTAKKLAEKGLAGVVKHATSGAAGVAGYESIRAAGEGASAGEIFDAGLEGAKLGGLFGAGLSVLGSSIAAVGRIPRYIREGQGARAAAAAEQQAKDLNTAANEFAKNFQAEWLDTRFNDMPIVAEPSVDPMFIAASVMQRVLGEDVMKVTSESAVARVAEKIRIARKYPGRLVGYTTAVDDAMRGVEAPMPVAARDAIEQVLEIGRMQNELAAGPMPAMPAEAPKQVPVPGMVGEMGGEATGFVPPAGVKPLKGIEAPVPSAAAPEPIVPEAPSPLPVQAPRESPLVPAGAVAPGPESIAPVGATASGAAPVPEPHTYPGYPELLQRIPGYAPPAKRVKPMKGLERMPAPTRVVEDAADAAEAGLTPAAESLKLVPPPPGPGAMHKIEQFADTQIAAAKQRIAKRGTRLQMFVDPADVADITVIGANYMLKGVVKFTDWANAMVREFGEGVRPHLRRLYQEATAAFEGRRPVGNDDVRRVSMNYLQRVGLGPGRVGDYAQLSKETSRRIAKAYDAMPVKPTGKAAGDAKRSYDAFIQEMEEQYEAIKRAGYEFEFTDGDPYPNSESMLNDLRENRRLRVFKTPEGSFHPYMTPEQNDKFRAVHDFFGHAKEGYQFGPRGEDNAWRAHAAMFSDDAIPAMTTETRGQNSWVNFMPGHEELSPTQRPYAEQKFGLLPEWAYDEVIKQRKAGAVRMAVGMTERASSGPTVEQTMKRLVRGIRPVTTPQGKTARLVADATQSVQEWASRNPESLNWYEQSLDRMIENAATEFPEAATAEGSTLLKLLIAITSQRTSVPVNFAKAITLFDNMQKSGFAPLVGRQGQEISLSARSLLPKVNRIIEEQGVNNLAPFLLSKDKKGNYEAVNVLGPKVGRFFLNLMGIRDEVTVDVWMARWFSRVTGNPVDEAPTEGQRRLVADAVTQAAEKLGLEPAQVQAALWDREKSVWRSAGFANESLDFGTASKVIMKNRAQRREEFLAKLKNPEQVSFFDLAAGQEGFVLMKPPKPTALKQQQTLIAAALGKPTKVQDIISATKYTYDSASVWLGPDGKLYLVPSHEKSALAATKKAKISDRVGVNYQGNYRWENHALLQRGFARIQVFRENVAGQFVQPATPQQRRALAELNRGRSFHGVISGYDGSDESGLYETWPEILRAFDKME